MVNAGHRNGRDVEALDLCLCCGRPDGRKEGIVRMTWVVRLRRFHGDYLSGGLLSTLRLLGKAAAATCVTLS